MLSSADEHAQTSVFEHGDRYSPRPAGAQTAEKQHAGLLKPDAQPSAARIRLPEGAAGRSLPRCGELASRTPTRHRARTGNLKVF